MIIETNGMRPKEWVMIFDDFDFSYLFSNLYLSFSLLPPSRKIVCFF